jgi:hypothetical protein
MFDRLWEGKEKGWLGLPIPEAVVLIVVDRWL